jgi:hypothetical protein
MPSSSVIVRQLHMPAIGDLDKDGLTPGWSLDRERPPLKLDREGCEAGLDRQSLRQARLEVETAVVLGALNEAT